MTTFFNCKSKRMDNKMNTEITFKEKNVTKELYSSDKSKLLILDYKESKNPVISFKYRVIDAQTKKEIISGIFSGIKMEWNNNISIKGHKYIGMVEGQDDGVLTSGSKIANKNITIIKIN